jgi:hypothetical protein
MPGKDLALVEEYKRERPQSSLGYRTPTSSPKRSDPLHEKIEAGHGQPREGFVRLSHFGSPFLENSEGLSSLGLCIGNLREHAVWSLASDLRPGERVD